MKELADSLWNMPAQELVMGLIQFMVPIAVVLAALSALVIWQIVRQYRRMKAMQDRHDARLKRLGF